VEGADRTLKDDPAWRAAERIEGWAGEVRVNLLRLSAVGLFYGYHLLNYHLLGAQLPAGFHLRVTGIAVAWAIAGLALHLALGRRWDPPWLKYAAMAGDAFLATTLLALSDGPRSPLLVLLFLLVATSALRLRLRAVWSATLFALASYAFLCGYARWFREELRVERTHQVIFAIGLVCAGLVAGQAVRQARRFARDYAERVRITAGKEPAA